MAIIETGDYLGFEGPNCWCHTAFSEELTFNGEPIAAGSSLSKLISLDSMPGNLQTDLNKVRWYLGYSGIGFQGENVREVIGEDTVMYFPDEVTDSEDAVQKVSLLFFVVCNIEQVLACLNIKCCCNVRMR